MPRLSIPQLRLLYARRRRELLSEPEVELPDPVVELPDPEPSLSVEDIARVMNDLGLLNHLMEYTPSASIAKTVATRTAEFLQFSRAGITSSDLPQALLQLSPAELEAYLKYLHDTRNRVACTVRT
jgi:hypothetical protein